MSTQRSNKAGTSTTTHGTAVTPTASTEVVAPATRNPVPATATDQGPSAAATAAAQGPASAAPSPEVTATGAITTDDPGVLALRGATVTLRAWGDALAPQVHALEPGVVVRINVAATNLVPAMVAMARLLTDQPDLAPRVDPVALATAAARIQANEILLQLLRDLQTQVQDTLVMNQSMPWQDTRDAYKTATVVARKDKSVALALAPMKALFQRAPRAVTATRNAADLSRRATNAATRAARVAQKAETARQRAATVTGTNAPPQPTPGPGVDQGPAHSTPTAGSAATPVTPGTTPSR